MDFLDSDIPCTVREIRARIERCREDDFVLLSVPELFFWELGLEYIGTDTITMEVKE